MLRLGIPLKRRLAPAAPRALAACALGLAALCALGLAGCGSQRATKTPATPARAHAAAAKPRALYIYSSLPHTGPQAPDSRQIEQGIRAALDQWKHQVDLSHVLYRVYYQPLSDSPTPRTVRRGNRRTVTSSASGGWSALAAIRSAETAARNPNTVAYIGNLDSGATELSLPILNQAGIVQLTPGSGYPGLTVTVPGVTLSTPPPEPDRYYPQGKGSLLRLVPNDLVQAAAIAQWLKKMPTCNKLAAVSFAGDQESSALVALIGKRARSDGLAFLPTPSPGTQPTKYPAYVATQLVHNQVNCVALTGPVAPAVRFATQVHTSLPGATIVGTNGLCNPQWTDPGRGGVPAKVDPVLYCATSELPLDKYPGGTSFDARFRRADHRGATAYALLGYVAGTLVLKAIAGADTPDVRGAVMSNLANNVTNGAAYTFDSPDGDLSGDLGDEYGLDKVENGNLQTYRVLSP